MVVVACGVDKQDSQRKFSQLKTLAGKGLLTNGRQGVMLEQAFGQNGYVEEKHTLFTTFMTLEEKLLLKVSRTVG